jgi:protoheme IX farnesyltransferase
MDFKKLPTYYQLAKPGIIYGNILTAAAGYLLASHWKDPNKFIFTIIGSSLVIGGACVLNNILDRNLDKAMERTSKRALAINLIPVKSALIYGASLELVGLILLGIFTNGLTVVFALLGVFFYVVVYGWAKRHTVYSTIVGAISGSIPPVIGYVSYTNSFDSTAVIIFFMLVFWQLAHFYAIGLYREEDYRAAKLPIWPIVKGTYSTKLQILASILLFSLFSLTLFIFGTVGYSYLVFMLLVGFGWFYIANKNSKFMTIKNWGRKVFIQSLTVILLTSLALAIGPLLP